MSLPPIINDLSDQLSIHLFPDDEGQPKIDIIKVNFKEIEGKTTHLFLTPCEALELAAGLANTVQMYLYNQAQYRNDILEPRLALAKQRKPEQQQTL